MSTLNTTNITHASSSSNSIVLAADGKVTYAATSGTTNFTISDGNLVIGTNGHGIDFSASEGGSATGDSVLNDYETGTWTPTCTGGYTSLSYVDQKGRYLKIGNLVYAQFRLGISAGTIQGGSYSIGVGPLPFTPSNWTGEQPAGGSMIHSSIDSFVDGAGHWPYITGGDAASVSFQDSGSGATTRAGADITSNKFIQGQLLYSTGLS